PQPRLRPARQGDPRRDPQQRRVPDDQQRLPPPGLPEEGRRLRSSGGLRSDQQEDRLDAPRRRVTLHARGLRQADRPHLPFAGAPVAPSAGARPQLARAMDEEPASAAGGFLVEDDAATLLQGQMRKGAFLHALREEACAAANRELARVGRDTEGCPYLERWFD